MSVYNPRALRRNPVYNVERKRRRRQEWAAHWAENDPHLIPGTRVCSRCGEEKDRTEFAYNRTASTGLQSVCKICGMKRHRERRYGTPDLDHDACVLCGGGIRLAQDHCHETGTRRGTLCMKCNTLLGLSGDDPALLRRAALYLEQWSKLTTPESLAVGLGPDCAGKAGA